MWHVNKYPNSDREKREIETSEEKRRIQSKQARMKVQRTQKKGCIQVATVLESSSDPSFHAYTGSRGLRNFFCV